MHRGALLALGAAALFGVSAPLAKLLLRTGSPQLVAGLLYLGSGGGLLLLRLARHGRAHSEAPLARRDVGWLAGAIALGGIVGPLLLMLGLSRTPAASASLLLNLEAVFTALVAWLVFRENLNRRVAAGLTAIVAGGLVLTWSGTPAGGGGLLGPLLVVGACASWAIDNNLTQKVSGGDPVQIAMLKGLVAGSANTAMALALGARWPDPLPLAEMLLLGFLGYGVSLVMFVLALRHVGTARSGAYFSVAPFVGAAVSLALFPEPQSIGFLVGGGLMAIGVWLHLTERHEHTHAHEALDHAHRHVHDAHHRHEHGPEDPPGEPHSHRHRHEPLAHTHPHYPDIHHRHRHGSP